MADAFTPTFNLTLPEVGASFDTWGTKLNNNLSEIDKFMVPPGGIIMWSGAVVDIPANWALCDGTNGTPDLRGMFVVGAGGSYAVGATGGAETVTLTEAQIPAHDHTASSGSAGGHTHTASSGSAGDHNHGGATGSAGSHNHGGATGSGGVHSHSGSANSAGAHTHSFDAGTTASTNGPRALRAESSFATQSTNSAGAHTHSLSINNSSSHAHSISTQASHTHSISTSTDGAHTHSITVNSVSSHTHSVTVDNTGGGGSHENLPPYYALAFIMNVG